MQFNTYTSAGAHIAAEMVNLPAATATQLAAVLRRHDIHRPVPTGSELDELHAWTVRLREVFETTSDWRRATLVDALLVASDCRARLVTHDGLPFHLHYAPVATDVAARVKALTAAGLAHVVSEGGGSRIGCCARASCSQAFVDTSRNGGRRFCTVRCANQVNVARHRARQRIAATAGSRS